MTGLLITLDAVGGVWRYAMDLGRIAVEAGLRPVFAGQGPAPTPGQRAEAEALGPLEWGDAPLDWMAAGPADLAPVPAWIDSLAARHDLGLLHLNLPTQAVGLSSNLPVVVACHSCLATWFAVMRDDEPPPDLAWHRDLTRAGCRAATVVVAPSASHAALMAQVYGIGGIRIVHNASRSAERPWSPGQGVVAAGRWWDEGKNAAVLDAAAGSGPMSVTMIGSTEGPDGHVQVLRHALAPGPLSHAETLTRIAGAAIFVSPSRYEPFGLIALEAARASRPLVLADIPTYRELWDGAALFFPPGDADALSRALLELDAAPDRRRKLGTAARRRAARYGAEQQARAMTALWRGALARSMETA